MVAERVDVDTENYVSLARDHREIRVVDGNAEHLDTYSQDVELLLLGTRPGVLCSTGSSLGGCVASQMAQTGEETERKDCS